MTGPCPVLAIVAREQTAGRGRQGRNWVSDSDVGIYVTIVRPVATGSCLQTLPQLVGVGLARSLRDLGCEVGLKWPNDLQVEGKKLGGVLIETLTRPDEGVAAIIGFVINHGHRDDQLPTRASTSLRLQMDPLPDLSTVVAEVLRGVEAELSHLGDIPYARERYEELSIHDRGEQLRCTMGGRQIEGTFLGFDERGFLRLDVSGRERILASGEVLE